MTTTRQALDKNKVEESRTRILNAALIVAAKPGGWSKLTRDGVARQAGCAESLVSKYFGTMDGFRRTIMRAAVKESHISIIAQGLAMGDKFAQRASDEQKEKVAQSIRGS